MPKGTVNTELVKQAYTKVQYDSDMLLEFQQCCDPNDGPMFFMKKYVNIQHPTRGSIFYRAYPFQNELLNSYHDFRFSISMLGRQM